MRGKPEAVVQVSRLQYGNIDPHGSPTTEFALFRAPFDYRPLWIRGSIVSRGFMGNHVAAARSATATSSGALPTTRWFRVFSNKTENVFPRNEADVVSCTFRSARMSVRIKDKYSWLPAVPSTRRGVRPVGSNLMEYTIEEVRHGTRRVAFDKPARNAKNLLVWTQRSLANCRLRVAVGTFNIYP